MPSLRESKRYLAFEIVSKTGVGSFQTMRASILGMIQAFLGQMGAAKAGIRIVRDRWDSARQRGIIRINTRHVASVKSALLFGERIERHRIIIRSLGLSGSLKKMQ
ncbi:MAG: Rpp14/Pop5 family protein [archaeon]